MVQAVRLSFPDICSEVRRLVNQGRVHRSQPIADLSCFYSPTEWSEIRHQLCLNDYCLTHPVCDLLTHEDWPND